MIFLYQIVSCPYLHCWKLERSSVGRAAVGEGLTVAHVCGAGGVVLQGTENFLPGTENFPLQGVGKMTILVQRHAGDVCLIDGKIFS